MHDLVLAGVLLSKVSHIALPIRHDGAATLPLFVGASLR